MTPAPFRPTTILGIDTTTRIAAAGVLRGGARLADRTQDRPDGHAAIVASLVEATLADAAIGSDEIEAVAVAVGPGSFTGIRVGLGFAKGMAFARALPLVGVGTLDAMAEGAPAPDLPVAACLDARKGEVYLALYDPAEQGKPRRQVGSTLALSPDEAVSRIAEWVPEGEAFVVGDGPSVYGSSFSPLERRGVRCVSLGELGSRGTVVAEIGARLLESGDGQSPQEVVAVYVRPSAAEARRAASRPR